ncbi:hypothetical protein FGO68_gene8045 [Halteria grandinella]|uniref:Uncharacterized protein n=1 Tax=Halteria grandinella TaxID=5974 RepID=A0A8J8NYN5_HALGN|nr:hypothetical protein FGO68_gene8045 [Halteria grandinella]
MLLFPIYINLQLPYLQIFLLNLKQVLIRFLLLILNLPAQISYKQTPVINGNEAFLLVQLQFLDFLLDFLDLLAELFSHLFLVLDAALHASDFFKQFGDSLFLAVQFRFLTALAFIWKLGEGLL